MSAAPGRNAGIAYQPSLDGVRAIAVTMVLLFHGDVSWMRGGYFGVSMFFTLSGFLITSLMLREVDTTGRVDVGGFYARRLRRLLPASLVCLAAVWIAAGSDLWTGVQHLRRDALGALFQVANWVQLGAGESYTDLQSHQAGIVSPLDHYWSLAIEEQFYWVWPLVFWGLARLARRRGIGLHRVMGALALTLAGAAPLVAWLLGSDAAYWATPARAAEIVFGCWLAVAVGAGRLRPSRWMAPCALVSAVALGVVLPATGGPAYHGAFPLLAVVSTVLILGLQAPGPATAVLSARPLVALGRISYGVYLYHLPVFVLMSEQRMGTDGTVLLIERLGVTLAVATVSYRLVERPVRYGRIDRRLTFGVSGITMAGVSAVVLLLPAGADLVYYRPDPALAEAASIRPVVQAGAASSTAVPGPAVTTTQLPSAPSTAPALTESTVASTTTTTEPPPLGRPARILVVGDSTAMATGAGLVAWAAAHPDVAQVSIDATPGCGFVRGGDVPSDDGVPFQENCDRVLDGELPGDLVALQPDVVMLMVTSRDIVPRVWAEGEGLLDPRDARYRARLRAGYRAITELITSTSPARVVWIRQPDTDPYWLGEPNPFTDPELIGIREDVIRETIAERPERAQLLDLRAWMEANGLALDHEARPDGLHFAPDAALAVATEWLGPQLVLAARENAAGGLPS
ncbi:MAG: acyltransferase family protein [Ilumatobacteraceae bacterium]